MPHKSDSIIMLSAEKKRRKRGVPCCSGPSGSVVSSNSEKPARGTEPSSGCASSWSASRSAPNFSASQASSAPASSDPRSTAASYTSSTDRKSTRLNSSHGYISYAVFCLKKKKKTREIHTSITNPHYGLHVLALNQC